VTPLYNPRVDPRDHHLHLSGAVIDPLTPIGRAAVFLPRPNDTARVAIRANLRARLPSG
jgi:hypothetical protein